MDKVAVKMRQAEEHSPARSLFFAADRAGHHVARGKITAGMVPRHERLT